MTLDEAIKHAEEKAEDLREEGNIKQNRNNTDESILADRCIKCAEEHEQLAEWLKELKQLREQKDGDLISRQAVLSKIKEVCFSKEWVQFRVDYGSNGQRDFLINYIEQLPPSTSQPSAKKTDGDLITKIDKLPRIKIGNSNSPTVKYCIDEVLLYDLFECYKESEEE